MTTKTTKTPTRAEDLGWVHTHDGKTSAGKWTPVCYHDGAKCHVTRSAWTALHAGRTPDVSAADWTALRPAKRAPEDVAADALVVVQADAAVAAVASAVQAQVRMAEKVKAKSAPFADFREGVYAASVQDVLAAASKIAEGEAVHAVLESELKAEASERKAARAGVVTNGYASAYGQKDATPVPPITPRTAQDIVDMLQACADEHVGKRTTNGNIAASFFQRAIDVVRDDDVATLQRWCALRASPEWVQQCPDQRRRVQSKTAALILAML